MTRTIKGIIFAACILAVAAVSCQKDDTLYYNNLTMGNVVNGRFVSDQGNIFNIVDQTCEGEIEEMKRAIVLCDVLNETAGTEKEYDVKLTNLRSVLEKKPVHISQATSEEIAVIDPVNIEELWYSGGYINMLISFFVKPDSKVEHVINLVYDKNEDGSYTFNLRHNANGETATTANVSGMKQAGAYVSFPLKDAVPENQAVLKFRWSWYEPSIVTGLGWDLNTRKDYPFDYEWQRSGFEQVPNVKSFRSTNNLY